MLDIEFNTAATSRARDIATHGFPGAAACRRKFLRFFPQGFADATYLAWERDYKWAVHRRWKHALNKAELENLLERREYSEVARRAVQIESRTNLLFSFEKIALRDAVRTTATARLFADGLYDFLFGEAPQPERFGGWCDTIAALPRKQTRVLTWPLVTVFGFLASPSRHIFLKPVVSRNAAEAYGFPFPYRSRPSWDSYAKFLDLARVVRRDLSEVKT